MILEKLKAIFNAPLAGAAPVAPAVPAVPAEPGEPIDSMTGMDCPLQDGRVMHCDPDMQVGAKCTIDGQPAPAGDYTMQDGSVCTVDDSGTMTNIAPPSPVTTTPPAEPTFEERVAAIEETLKKMQQPQCSTQYASQDELKEAKAKIEKQDEVIKGLFELAEKLAETPTAEPATLTPNKKIGFEKAQARERKLEEIGNAITQLKNKK